MTLKGNKAPFGCTLRRAAARPPTVRATLAGPVRSPADRRSYLRGVLSMEKMQVTPLSGQGSHQIAALGKANALIIVPEGTQSLAVGDEADVLVLP